MRSIVNFEISANFRDKVEIKEPIKVAKIIDNIKPTRHFSKIIRERICILKLNMGSTCPYILPTRLDFKTQGKFYLYY